MGTQNGIFEDHHPTAGFTALKILAGTGGLVALAFALNSTTATAPRSSVQPLSSIDSVLNRSDLYFQPGVTPFDAVIIRADGQQDTVRGVLSYQLDLVTRHHTSLLQEKSNQSWIPLTAADSLVVLPRQSSYTKQP